MKRRSLLLFVAAGGLAGQPLFADKMSFEQLPPSVQAEARKQTGGATIEDIDRTTSNGRTVYEIAFKKNGQHTELLLEDSATNQLSTASATQPQSGKMTIQEVPEMVRNIILAKAAGNRIEDIDRQVRDGQTTYEAAFKVNGQHQELLVAENGMILRDLLATNSISTNAVGAPPSTATGQNQGSSRWFRRGQPTASTNLVSSNVTLSASVQVQPSEVPVPVVRAFHNQIGRRSIEDVERGTWNGRTVYQAAYQLNGQPVRLQVFEDGTPVTTSPAIGSAATSQTGSSTNFSNVQLSGGVKIQQSELPAAVLNAIKTQAGSAQIEDIERGAWNGRTVYEAAYKNRGQHTELQVFEDGSLVVSTNRP
ncbi:MAG: PepSY-like domain-containing protein [Verrucomicrobiota bacterium]|nr:PepSY-like domain-containing protein [Verrucomicrobiota bacterium]